ERQAEAGQRPGEQPAVHAEYPGPARLEDQVHVGVRQDRLLVRRLAAQVPADDPVVVHERRERVRRLMPVQPEMRRGQVRPEHATAHGPDGGIWHLISLICRVSSRPPDPASIGSITMEQKNLSAEMAAAAAEAARVVNGVPEGTLNAPTPCGDWDLRTLLNHTILWTSYSAERRAHGESVAEDLMNKDFTADPGFRADYARQIGKAVQAWSDPQTWAGTLNVMGDATPA